MKQYTIIYTYKHPKMGFSNSITINTYSLENAIKEAQNKVVETYGQSEFKRFTFKPDANNCGVVIL